jgi:hypothetical protein
MTSKNLSKAQALELVSRRLRIISTPEEPFVVIHSLTIEKSYGWVFFYNTKRFVETGLNQHRLTGNGPIIVNKHDGSIQCHGSSIPELACLAEYERKHTEPRKDG